MLSTPSLKFNQYFSLGALRLAKMVSAFCILLVYGRTAGAGSLMDGWVYSTSLIGVISLLTWGSINEVARAYIMGVLSEDSKDIRASRIAGILLCMTLLSFALVVLFMSFLPKNISLFIPERMLQSAPETAHIFSLLLPYLFFAQVSVFLTCVLNCYEKIYFPEVFDIIGNLLVAGVVFYLFERYALLAFVIGLYAGTIFSAICKLLLFTISRLGRLTRSSFPSGSRDVGGLIRFAAPLFFSYGIGQLYVLVERFFSAMLGERVVSYIHYSSYLKNAFQGLLVGLIFTLVMPHLSKIFRELGDVAFRKEVLSAFRTTNFALIVIVPIIIVGSPIYLSLILGEVVESWSNLVYLTRFYALSLLPVVIFAFVGVVMISSLKTREYAFIGVLSQLISATLIYVGIDYLGVYIFPSALVIGSALSVVVISTRVPEVKHFFFDATKHIALSLGAGLVALATCLFLELFIDKSNLVAVWVASTTLIFFWLVMVYVWFLIDRSERPQS